MSPTFRFVCFFVVVFMIKVLAAIPAPSVSPTPSSPRRVRAPRPRLGNGAAFAAGVAEEGGEH